jgi:hypothetical protein
MFCDLLGLMPVAARLSPEDLREVIYATAGLEALEWFQAQVGVASVGNLIGAGAAQQDSVVGSAPAKPAALDAATAR